MNAFSSDLESDLNNSLGKDFLNNKFIYLFTRKIVMSSIKVRQITVQPAAR